MDEPVPSLQDPAWLRAVIQAAQPVAGAPEAGPGRLKRWFRKAVAKASWRGNAELFADQQAMNAAVIEALKNLAETVRGLQANQRSAMRQVMEPEWIHESLRTLQGDVQSLRRERMAADADGDAVLGESTSGAPAIGFEAYYRAFEDTFRGSQEVIEGRLEVYLPWVLKSLNGLSEPVWLDLGCGRGEWLRLLGRAGITGIGVDSNQGMADAANATGLQVIVDDLIRHLRSRGTGTVDGLSAFHVVEHLPPDLVLELLIEGRRVVRPGGALILETPNPENLQVGAHTFYLDPTHRNPVPPQLLAFMAGQAGWDEVDVLRLHPDGRDLKRALKAWKGHTALEKAATMMFGPRDYSVLARRPMAG